MRRRAATLLWVAIYTFFFLPLAPVWAQSILPVADSSPRIQHQPFEQPVMVGEPLDIEAVIIAGTSVEAVLLYRKIGESNYSSLPMKHRGEGLYTAKIPKKEVVSPGFQYLIQATDAHGNMTTYGQPAPPGAFDLKPLTVMVEARPSIVDREFTERVFPGDGPPASEGEAQTVAPPWYKKWWVWTIVGVVAAGVAVAGGGGGGGKSEGGGGPPTGTLTISGPVPQSP